MSHINLEDYVGQKVVIELHNGEEFFGVCTGDNRKTSEFRYNIGRYARWYNKFGRYTDSCCRGPYDIISIQSFSGPVYTGLAQRHPHVKLKEFVGQKVYIRLNKESHKLPKEFIGTCTEAGDYYEIGGFKFREGGGRILHPQQYIKEIYGENAYCIETKPLDNPLTPEVKKAIEVIKAAPAEEIAKAIMDNLSEEGIAQIIQQLIHQS